MTTTPTIVVEIAFATYDPATTNFFVLDSDVLDGVSLLGSNVTYTDVSSYVRAFSVKRGRQRALEAFAAGSATVVLDNRDSRFDPRNTTGPYASAGVTGVVPMRPILISAVYNGVTYRVFTGFVNTWTFDYSPGLADATATVACSDGLKLLSASDGRLAQVAAAQNAAALSTSVTVTTNQANTSTTGTTIVTANNGRSRLIETR